MRARTLPSVIWLLASLGACTSPCARGPTTTCWCPGDVVGESTCGDDGRYGACVCPGSTVTAPAPVVPTAPPPTTTPVPGPMVPSTIPVGVDPPPIGASTGVGARTAEIGAWLEGPVRGHDNSMAAIRSVSISGTEGDYRIRVQNQFGFRCALDFDAAGHPSAMRDCRSSEPGWGAEPASITVTCAPHDADVRCEAPYQLRSGTYTSRATFVFSRRAL